MKIKNLLTLGALLATSLAASRAAATTITAWDFDSYATGVVTNSPVPSTGSGTASALGFTIPSISCLPTCDIVATAGASTGASAAGWRIRGGDGTYANAGNPNGWTNAAAIGTQGAEFDVNTATYTNVQLTFDWYITGSGTAKLQVQYTSDGSTWLNASSISIGTNKMSLLTNSSSANTVSGAYLFATNGSRFYNAITVSFPSATANNSKFGVRLVNAATGADDVTTTGAAKPAGNIRFDNVIISGTLIPVTPVTIWDFDSGYITTDLVNTPAPSYGSGSAKSLGMENTYPDATGGYSHPSCDVTGTPGASTGGGASAWRVRGGGGTYSTAGNPNSGWCSDAPIGTQGAEFDVSTIALSEIQLNFDIYYTAAAPAQTQVEYTSDGVTWINCTNIVIPSGYDSSNAQLVTNNSDANTVTGVYISQISGGLSTFLTNIVCYFPLSCAGNPNFGVRIVNATTGASMVNSSGGAYNNNSGNWRFDNVTISGASGYVGGSSAALTPPLLTPASNVTVDSNSFSITFPAGNSAWASSISNIVVANSNLFTTGASAYNQGITIGATSITFSMTNAGSPINLAIFKTAGSKSIVIGATNYAQDAVSQIVGIGAPTAVKFSSVLQAPDANGATFVTQPALGIVDQYGNIVTNLYGTVTATVGSGAWGFGPGSGTAIILTNGLGSFTNLCATNSAMVSGAYIQFALAGTGLGSFAGLTTNSATFSLLAPPTSITAGDLMAEQQDVLTKNATICMVELNPTTANQTAPVNLFAIPATGSNALRQSSSGSCGRLALSDDHTLLCFTAGLCGDSTVADVTSINGRGCATFDHLGNYVFQTSYQGLGGSTANQTRSATTVDDITFFMGDKGGVYTNDNTSINAYIGYTVANGANVRSLKSFGGVVYALQQSGGSDPTATVLDIVPAADSGSHSLFPLEGFPIEGAVLDFYLYRSGNNGTNYDVCYYIDGTNATAGAIYKYYYTGTVDEGTGQPIWASAGPCWNTANGGDAICLATNASGNVDIYYTTGSGGTASNSVVHVVDNSAWNQPINLISTNVLYTVAATSSLRGLSLAPVAAVTATPVPVLPIKITTGSAAYLGTAGSGSFRFAFTNVSGAASSLYVYGTTNLTAPLHSWINLGNPIEAATGSYVFTNTMATNGAFFYLVSTNSSY